MNRYLYLGFVLVFVSGVSCRRLPNIQGKGSLFLQGIWNEDRVENSERLLNYTQYKLKFTCDSFYVDLTTHSKVNYYEENCFNNGIWKEYAKGVYQLKNDTLLLDGTYTKANYKQKVSGCYNIGRFLKTFVVKSSKVDSLLLENITDQRACSLILKEKINCIPKKL